MAIANPRIHIICGICGDNKSMKFEIEKEWDDLSENDNTYKDVVYISCRNCGSLTSLDEIIDQKS